MILTVLGSSGSVPGPGDPCPGYLLEHGGHRLLLDLGTGAFGALLTYGAGAAGAGAAGPGAAAPGWGRDHTAPAPHHLIARQAGELAASAGAGLLAVTHLRPWDDPGRAPAAAALRLPGPVVLARPGLRLVPGGATGAPHPEENGHRTRKRRDE